MSFNERPSQLRHKILHTPFIPDVVNLYSLLVPTGNGCTYFTPKIYAENITPTALPRSSLPCAHQTATQESTVLLSTNHMEKSCSSTERPYIAVGVHLFPSYLFSSNLPHTY